MLTKKCQTCCKKISSKNKKYCSILCRNKAAGKASADKKRRSNTMICHTCGLNYSVNPYKVKTNKYCSRRCNANAGIAKRKTNMD